MENKHTTLEERLTSFKEEFGKILEPVAFLMEKDRALTDAFLQLHEIALGDGAISRKSKLLMHAAITARACIILRRRPCIFWEQFAPEQRNRNYLKPRFQLSR